MAKGGSGLAAPDWQAGRSSLNSGVPWPSVEQAEARVLGIQRKLHKWASEDRVRRFTDLRNLVCDSATLMVAWQRVRRNRGSRSAGVDGQTAYHVEQVLGVERFLSELRQELRSGASGRWRSGSIRPQSAAARSAGWGSRRVGPRGAGRPQAGAGADQRGGEPWSYGFRPGRRTSEVHYLAFRSYEW